MTEQQAIRTPYPGPQTLALSCPIPDMLYGGARGGGKGGFLQLDWLRHAEACQGKARGLLVRKYLADLTDFIKETKAWYPKLGWTFREQDKEWVGPRGDVLQLKYLENEKDAERYQGFNLSWFAVDEAGQFKTPDVIDLLRATLRLPDVPEHRLRLTANPGGPGHEWLKKRYIDPAAPMQPFDDQVELPGGERIRVRRVFIPARLKDNPGCDTPEYRASLMQAASGRNWLVKAWLEGDWSISADGGVFEVDQVNEGEAPVITVLDGLPHHGRARIDRLVQGWDTAFTENTRNDESAGVTAGRDDSGRLWITNLTHGHWHPGDVAKQVIEQKRIWKPWKVQAEGGGAGASIEHLIRDAQRLGEIINFSLVSHMRDKIAKNAAFAAAVNSGQVWVPKGAAWWPYLRHQMQIFTGEDGMPDDCVDAGGVAFRELDRMMAAQPGPKTEPPAIIDPRRDDARRARLLAVPAETAGPRLMWR
jgi:predicted phage terminase large subunit-like protein